MRARAQDIVEPRSFEVMYRAELVSMVSLGASLTGSRESGADLAHEAMLRAYRAWDTVGALDRPGAWVRRVLINLATDGHRRKVHERRALVLVGRPTTVVPTDAINMPFWAAVRALPLRQRAAVVLHYIDDMSVDDIADVLQVSVGTIKSSLFSARKSLAKTLQADEPGDERGSP
jgi:RNA polymerase sigma-70 factor, ECF subfamily